MLRTLLALTTATLVLAAPVVSHASAPQAATPWIGIAIEAGAKGVAIREAFDRTPGARAGLRHGDEILAIDGHAVHRPDELIGRLQDKGIGEKVSLTVRRADKELTVVLALEGRPDDVDLLRDRLLDKPAPAIAAAETIGEHPSPVGDSAGKIVVLEFWATWCPSCNAAAPRLATLQTKYGADLRVIALSSEAPEVLSRHAAKHPIGYTVAHDTEGQIASKYLISALPTLVVIDRQGRVRYVDIGAGEKLDEVDAKVADLLKKR